MNPETEKIKALIDAVGAMAEVSAQYYKSLLDNDVPRPDAQALTRELLKTLLQR